MVLLISYNETILNFTQRYIFIFILINVRNPYAKCAMFLKHPFSMHHQFLFILHDIDMSIIFVNP